MGKTEAGIINSSVVSAYELPRGIVGASDGSIYIVGDEAANDIGMLLNADGNVQWAKQLNANAYYARHTVLMYLQMETLYNR